MHKITLIAILYRQRYGLTLIIKKHSLYKGALEHQIKIVSKMLSHPFRLLYKVVSFFFVCSEESC